MQLTLEEFKSMMVKNPGITPSPTGTIWKKLPYVVPNELIHVYVIKEGNTHTMKFVSPSAFEKLYNDLKNHDIIKNEYNMIFERRIENGNI